MIAIASTTYDPIGWRAFHSDRAANDESNRSGGRRVSRTATLDGGCAIYDTGYTDADRTLVVSVSRPTLQDMEFADHVCRNCPEIHVHSGDGCYLGVPERFAVGNGGLRITILITERLA
jgi:hypothetical protein